MTEYLTQYEQGFIDGLRAYAVNRDGAQYVGSMGVTLRKAIDERENTWNYLPPHDELLEALETLVLWHDKTAVKTAIELHPNNMWGKARAAIAKERGQS